MADNANGTVGFRVLTANIQCFPTNAMTLAQAREDMQRNAEVADIVLLQEIADRYHDLVLKAFPAPEWEVYFGREGNSEPIAFRRDKFRLVKGRVTLLHPPRAGIHGRRHITHVHLSAEPSNTEFHVTNLHMVPRAFSRPPADHRDLRIREWHAGIAKHLIEIDKLVESGAPVIGGGDYNRQLRQHKSLGSEVAGRKVTYAVDPNSIDLLWFVNGDRERWRLHSKEVFRDRNSDHAARLANVLLSSNGSASSEAVSLFGSSNGHGPSGQDHPQNNHASSNGNGNGNGTKPKKKKAKVKAAVPERKWPKPYVKTKYGDGVPQTVDWKTRAALEEAERILGYPLTLTQGSYNPGGVNASAHTHDLGGVVDLKPFEAKRKVRVLRSIGFAAWHRLPSQGPWPEHVHAVLINHGNLHPQAQAQVDDYRKGLNGLAGHAKDPTPRPSPIPIFKYPPTSPHPQEKVDSVEGHRVDSGQAKVGAIPQIGPAYPPRRTLDGVDTSHYQTGKIDLRKAQHAGLRFWYLKTTEGSTLPDKTYKKRIREARRAGVPVGSHHFASPDGGDAVMEANYFLKHADIRLGDMLPMLDLEGRRVLSRAQLTHWVGVWVTTVRRDLAKRGLVGNPIIYTQFDLDDAFGCKLWVSRYSNEFQAPRIPAPWKRAAIWQHSDGKIGPIQDVPGFGAVDVNALHPELPLSALRVRRPRKNSTDMDEIRRDLTLARKRIDDALKRLPER